MQTFIFTRGVFWQASTLNVLSNSGITCLSDIIIIWKRVFLVLRLPKKVFFFMSCKYKKSRTCRHLGNDSNYLCPKDQSSLSLG